MPGYRSRLHWSVAFPGVSSGVEQNFRSVPSFVPFAVQEEKELRSIDVNKGLGVDQDVSQICPESHVRQHLSLVDLIFASLQGQEATQIGKQFFGYRTTERT